MPRMRADAIQILVTLEERAKVQQMAAQNSLSMSSYARSRLMRAVQREAEQESWSKRPEEGLKRIRSALAGGARTCNSHHRWSNMPHPLSPAHLTDQHRTLTPQDGGRRHERQEPRFQRHARRRAVKPDTSEEVARSKDFAALMAEVRALKPGDVAGVQDLLYKAAGKAARDKITPLQAQMLVEAIKKSTGFKMEGLSKTFKKFFKTAQKEAEAEAAAAASGPGAGGRAGPGPLRAPALLLRCGRLHPG